MKANLQKRLEKEILESLDDLERFGTITCLNDDNDPLIIIGEIEIGGYTPSKREIRLAKEIIELAYPLYRRADPLTKAEFVKDVFKYNVSLDTIIETKPFKKILFTKKLVEVKLDKNGKYKAVTKRVRIK